jgi:pimeloyl-ACP methyl ester carboxylesterase
MTTFCLLHGAWHDRTCWEPLTYELSARGHRTVAPDLPYDDPAVGFAERTRPALQALEDIDDRVIVVGHSMASPYAALVAAATPGSLLVHLCPRLGSFPPPPDAPEMFRPGFPFPTSLPDGTSAWEPEQALAAMYSRLPAEIARELARRLRPLAPAAGEYPLPGHPEVETVLIYALDDEIFEPAWERFMASELLGVDPIAIAGGHFPMVEDPAALADLLDRLAHEREAGGDTPGE